MHDLRIITESPTAIGPIEDLATSDAVKVVVRTSDEIDPLTARSANAVYLVPATELTSDAWPRLRSRLAAANRRFLVAGAKLASADVVQACRDGAHDVLDLTDPSERWQAAITNAAQAQELWWQLYGAEVNEQPDRSRLIGRTAAMRALRQAIDRLGPTDATVMVLGESGTGKERIAEALHAAGGTGEFVAFNCAALPADMLEAELFGVTKGAYTGAHADRPGLVEQADGGTLFLDEVGEMAPAVQAKLLRFLETRTARRLGSNQTYRVNLRIVAATNRDLEAAMENGGFRADLFYRLSEITLQLPPLRERVEDIPLLVRAFVAAAGERFGKFYDAVDPELVTKLQAHVWPGNIRELKNTIDRLVLLHDGPVLRAGWWDAPALPVTHARMPAAHPAAQPTRDVTAPTVLRTRRDRLDRARALMAEGRLSQSEIAAEIGVNPSTLYRWRQAGQV